MEREILKHTSLMKELIFALEDQRTPYVLKLPEYKVVAQKNKEIESINEGEYLLPPWTSREGFQLRQRFVDKVTNPQMELELSKILASRHNVFKEFKNALKDDKMLWYAWESFSHNYMSNYLIEWLESELEADKLQALSEQEIDEYDNSWELLLEDMYVEVESCSSVPSSITAENQPWFNLMADLDWQQITLKLEKTAPFVARIFYAHNRGCAFVLDVEYDAVFNEGYYCALFADALKKESLKQLTALGVDTILALGGGVIGHGDGESDGFSIVVQQKNI